ncbi:DEAD/DEAH box helicase [Algiphilus sp.]|uniref:DEAD/DEAH box helicase n=1 Tax=Algiphilus sp. TaxID=1872431 RepID=UPI003B51D7A7
MSFEALGLGKALTNNCARAGYTMPSPVQQSAIPIVLRGSDLLASAQTGTGKTAAFLLPLLHQLSQAEVPTGRARTPRVLILAPTRELAGQIGDSARSYGNGLNVRSLTIFGGVGQRPQAQGIARGLDLLVATPGRLLDLHNQGLVDLSRVAHVVLDEADRMLDMGFIHDLKRILKLLPESRQTLLFSATFSDPILELAGRFLRSPERVQIAPEVTTAEGVTQHLVRTHKNHKRALLAWLVGQHPEWRQVLVFARTKHGADRLAKQMTMDGLPAVALHGGKSQGARRKALDGFRSGGTRIVVATDLAARGIDIDQLPCVINYELPHVAEDYVHRIGRTARAGATGVAISLVGRDEQSLLRDIERHLGRKIDTLDTSGFQPPQGAGREESASEARPSQRTQPSKKRPSGGPRRKDGSGEAREGGNERAPATRDARAPSGRKPQRRGRKRPAQGANRQGQGRG